MSERAEEIVAALAEREPLWEDVCCWCRVIDDHEPDCPWRMAVEHVANKGAG